MRELVCAHSVTAGAAQLVTVTTLAGFFGGTWHGRAPHAQFTLMVTGPALLLPRSGSALLASALELTAAVLLMAPQFAADVTALSVMLFAAPFARAPKPHVNTVPPGTGDETPQSAAFAPPTIQVRPAGSVSVMTTLFAIPVPFEHDEGDGPAPQRGVTAAVLHRSTLRIRHGDLPPAMLARTPHCASRVRCWRPESSPGDFSPGTSRAQHGHWLAAEGERSKRHIIAGTAKTG